MKRDPELAQAIRATAYFLWEQDGRPDSNGVDYWLRAKQAHLRQLAYDHWLNEGSPAGRDTDIWLSVARDVDEV